MLVMFKFLIRALVTGLCSLHENSLSYTLTMRDYTHICTYMHIHIITHTIVYSHKS